MKETQAGPSTAKQIMYCLTPEGTYTEMSMELSRTVQCGSPEYVCFNIVHNSKKLKTKMHF